MSVYLVPNVGEFEHLAEVVKRARASLISPESVRELILNDSDNAVTIAAMKPMDMKVIQRHAGTLLAELPAVLMAVPGLVYPGDWLSAAAGFTPVDWMEVERRLAKSGSTAFTLEQMDSLDVGAPVSTDDDYEIEADDVDG